MKEMTIEEVKKCLLDIVKEIDKICKENGIKYTAIGGTLIGAVRHKGFIPWDDDIDIAMTRAEYEKFIKIFNEKCNDKYRVLDYRLDEKYYYPFAKVIDKSTYLNEEMYIDYEEFGVYVDIFPMDKVSSKKLKLRMLKLKILAKKFSMSVCNDEFYKTKPFYKRIIRKFIQKHPYEYYIQKLDEMAQKENELDCEYIGTIIAGQGVKDVFPIELFEKYDYLDFEDTKLMVIREYDKFLTHRFGDYMKLPPVERRISEHKMKAYVRGE